MTLPVERIEPRILTIRGYRVLMDADLAEMCRKGMTVAVNAGRKICSVYSAEKYTNIE